MAIQLGLTRQEADAVAEPKTVVQFGDCYDVYSDTDLNTPPMNPATDSMVVATPQAQPIP